MTEISTEQKIEYLLSKWDQLEPFDKQLLIFCGIKPKEEKRAAE